MGNDTRGHREARKLYPLGGPCEHNGCDAPAIDRHHVDGDSSNNARANIQLLCRRHHMEADGRLATLATHVPAPHSPKPCSNCGVPSKPHRRGRCAACAMYLRNHGVERPVAADGSSVLRPPAPRPCGDCGRTVNPGERFIRGRCSACYKRWWRRQS